MAYTNIDFTLQILAMQWQKTLTNVASILTKCKHLNVGTIFHSSTTNNDQDIPNIVRHIANIKILGYCCFATRKLLRESSPGKRLKNQCFYFAFFEHLKCLECDLETVYCSFAGCKTEQPGKRTCAASRRTSGLMKHFFL